MACGRSQWLALGSGFAAPRPGSQTRSRWNSAERHACLTITVTKRTVQGSTTRGVEETSDCFGSSGGVSPRRTESCCIPDVTGRGRFSEAAIPWGRPHDLTIPGDTLSLTYSVQVDSNSVSVGSVLLAGCNFFFFLREIIFAGLAVGSCLVWGSVPHPKRLLSCLM